MTKTIPTKPCAIGWDDIIDKCSFSKPENLTPREKVVWLSYWYSTEVELVGHNEYFQNRISFDFSETVSALKEIDAFEHASTLEKALAAIGSTEKEPQSSEEFLSRISQADLHEFDEAYEKARTSVASCLVTYVNSHENEFAGWIGKPSFVPRSGWALIACLLVPALFVFYASAKDLNGDIGKRVRSATIAALLGAAGFLALQAWRWLNEIMSRPGLQRKTAVMAKSAAGLFYLIVLPAILLGILLLAAYFI